MASCICIYSFIEGDDPSKYPTLYTSTAMDMCHSARNANSPLLTFSSEVGPASYRNIPPGQDQRQTENRGRKWNLLSMSVFSRLSGNGLFRHSSRRQRKKRINPLDSSLFHSPNLSRLHAPLPSLPHIAFPPSSGPSPWQSDLHNSIDSMSSSSFRKSACPSFPASQAYPSKALRGTSDRFDSLPTCDSFIKLTPPAHRYMGPTQQIENLMNAFSSSSSSPSLVATPTSTLGQTQSELYEQQRRVQPASNHQACSSFFSFQINTHQREVQNTHIPFSSQVGFTGRAQSQGTFYQREKHFHNQDYQFEDQPRWWQGKACQDELDQGLSAFREKGRKIPRNSRFVNRNHGQEGISRSLMNPEHHAACSSGFARPLAVSKDSWLFVEEGEDDVFMSAQEMKRMGQRADEELNACSSDSEDIWVLQTEL